MAVTVDETNYVVKVEDNVTKIIVGGISNIPGPAGIGLPAGGTTNQVLEKTSDTDYDTQWVTNPVGVTVHDQLTGLADDDHPQYHNDTRGDTRYYTKTLLDGGQLNSLYYTESETDTLLSGKSDTSHTHTESDITDLGTYLTGVAWGDITGTLSAQTDLQTALNGKSDTSHLHTGVYEPVFTKNTGFNLNLGTSAGTVSEGDHLHTGVYAPTIHTHTESDITDLQNYLLNITGESIKSLSDVFTTMVPTDGQVLTFDTTNGWQGETPVTGVTDHGALTGLTDDDHTAYHNDTRGDIRYYTKALLDGGQLDNRYYTETETDTLLSGKAPTVHTHTESDISDLQNYLLNITGEPLSDLNDVTITTITAGELLKWNGTAWINNTLAEAGISPTGHTHTESDITNLGSYITGVAWGDITGTLSAQTDLQSALDGKSDTSHLHTGVYEPVFTKNTGFNLNLGTSAGTVSEGDHNHSGVYAPVVHTHVMADVTDSTWISDITGQTVGSLSDVAITTPIVRNGLMYDGVGSWTNRLLVEADISDLGTYLTGVAWGDITGTLSAQTDLQSALDGKSDTSHLHTGVYEPVFTKNTGFNLNLGTTTGTVSEGDHNHSGVYAPTVHTHTESDITDLQSYLLNITSESVGSLSDVNVTTPGVRHALMYDGVDSWDNRLLVEADISDLGTYLTGVAWGDITGTLSAQIDLQSALDGKAASVHTHVMADVTDSTWISDITGSNLADLANVTETTTTTGDLVRWSGTAWVNYADSNYATSSHLHTGVYEPVFTKNTGFNLNLGTSAGTVSEGDHNHSGVYAPTVHTHTESDITDLQTYAVAGGAYHDGFSDFVANEHIDWTVTGAEDIHVDRIPVVPSVLNTQTGTTYTLVLTDAGKIVEMNNAGANTLTVPPNSSVAFDIGTEIDIVQYGAGQTTVVQGTGVTIRTAETLLLQDQYSGATLYKRGTDEWVLVGRLEAA